MTYYLILFEYDYQLCLVDHYAGLIFSALIPAIHYSRGIVFHVYRFESSQIFMCHSAQSMYFCTNDSLNQNAFKIPCGLSMLNNKSFYFVMGNFSIYGIYCLYLYYSSCEKVERDFCTRGFIVTGNFIVDKVISLKSY